MNHRSAIAVLLVVAFQMMFNVSSVVTDHTEDDCSVVQCPKHPQIQCPSDSLLKAWPSTEDDDDIDEGENDATSNPFDRLAAAGLIEELHPATVGQNKMTTSGPFMGEQQQQQHKLSKRSPRLMQREKIRIVAGDFRQFHEPPFNHHQHHQAEQKYKRDLASSSPAAEAELKRCCPQFQCICKSCQPMSNCSRGMVAVEAERALGLPGNCCHQYECIPTPPDCAGPKSLHRTYWRDECTKCDCIEGHELCQHLCYDHRREDVSRGNCFSAYLNRPKLNGESWHEDDYCTECRCVNGERRCVANVCPAVECSNPVKLDRKCCKVCLATTENPESTAWTESSLSPSTKTTTSSSSSSSTTVNYDSTTNNQSFHQPDSTLSPKSIDSSTDERTTSTTPNTEKTTKEIRNILWEIDWVVLLALLFIICALTVGFLINQSRENKKKIYLTISSSESSSSQASTVILNV